jgi:hypothetical protein
VIARRLSVDLVGVPADVLVVGVEVLVRPDLVRIDLPVEGAAVVEDLVGPLPGLGFAPPPALLILKAKSS